MTALIIFSVMCMLMFIITFIALIDAEMGIAGFCGMLSLLFLVGVIDIVNLKEQSECESTVVHKEVPSLNNSDPTMDPLYRDLENTYDFSK